MDSIKLNDEVVDYLGSIEVQHRNYADIWPFLRRGEWGEGKILITPQIPFAIAAILTHYRYTIAPSYVGHMMSIKNETEIEGMRRAYLRDGLSFVSKVPRS